MRAIDGDYLFTAQSLLELAAEAKSLWESRPDTEKRDFVAKLILELRLRDRTVEYDSKKPFEVLSRMRENESWRPPLAPGLHPEQTFRLLTDWYL